MCDLTIEAIEGHSLRAMPEAFANELLNLVDAGGVVIAKQYLSLEEVEALRGAAYALARRKGAQWTPYYKGCDDFHHYDTNDAADDERRRREGRPLRPRRFHLYKFLPWNRRPEIFEGAVRAVVALRNAFYGQPADFGLDPDEGVFTVPQLLHYERGGDFLGAHSDTDFHERQGLATKIELITLLSRKGADFEQGGLFVEEDGKRIDLDGAAEPGDIVMYDVTGIHGCAPVDPAGRPDPDGVLGRWVLLVPPYITEKHLREPAAA